MLEVFNPTAGPATGRTIMAPRSGTLDGKRLGIIWNGRAHGDEVLRAVVDLLSQKYNFASVLFKKKPYIGNIAPREMFEEIQANSDMVITGIGD